MKNTCIYCNGTADHKAIGAEMRRKRVATGLSQKQFGEILGITGSYVSDLEHGRRPWSFSKVERFNIALKGAA